MEEGLLRGAEDDLIAWGVLERDPDLRTTRRFRGALMRAAASLQEEERGGRPRAGHPVEVSVREALAIFPLPPGASVRREHELLVTGVQMASLPANVRELLER